MVYNSGTAQTRTPPRPDQRRATIAALPHGVAGNGCDMRQAGELRIRHAVRECREMISQVGKCMLECMISGPVRKPIIEFM